MRCFRGGPFEPSQRTRRPAKGRRYPYPYAQSGEPLRFGGGGSDDRRAARDADTARGNASANALAREPAGGNALTREPDGGAGSRSEPHLERRSREDRATRAPQGDPTQPNGGWEFPGQSARRGGGIRFAAEGEPHARPQGRGGREEPGIG